MEHLGIARMEAATRRTAVSLSLPKLSRDAHWALWGRLAVIVAVCLILAVLAMFGRQEPGRAYDARGAGFRWSAVDPTTGRDVPRAEWVARALQGA